MGVECAGKFNNQIINILILEIVVSNKGLKLTSWTNQSTLNVKDAKERVYIRVMECASE
jgi:hypothetical protein